MISKNQFYIVFILSVVFFFRMFSIFSMLPTVGIYEMYLRTSNKKLIGISIGVYGLMQAILQIPLGLLSDYINRKFIIIFGLLIFSIGSIVGAYTNDIYGIIVCRFLQGLSAISSTIVALLFDFIEKKNYKISMSLVGSFIGLSFLCSIVFVPILLSKIGLSGLFIIISVLNLISVLLILSIPNYKCEHIKDKFPISIKQIVNMSIKRNLLVENYSIFFLHSILVSVFFVLPRMMINIGLSTFDHWKIYLITILLSYCVLTLVMFILRIKTYFLFLYSLIFLLISEFVLLFFHYKLYFMFIGIQIFFSVFSIIETLLPIFVRNKLNKNYIGLEMGIYSTSQFLGSAFGGLSSGYFYQIYGIQSVFLYCILVTVIWFIIFLFTKRYLIS